MERKNYKTEGRERLMKFLSTHPDCQFTAEEITQKIPGAAQSSLYRHLSDLCSQEIVRKFRSEERQCSVYQYVGERCDCKRHFHAKCMICGKLEHLDCGDSVEFSDHLLEEHGFEIDCGASILYGVCRECRRKKEEELVGRDC